MSHLDSLESLFFMMQRTPEYTSGDPDVNTWKRFKPITKIVEVTDLESSKFTSLAKG